eukprot:scaffold22045_cov111-Isochrysis_galbana.AAC.8
MASDVSSRMRSGAKSAASPPHHVAAATGACAPPANRDGRLAAAHGIGAGRARAYATERLACISATAAITRHSSSAPAASADAVGGEPAGASVAGGSTPPLPPSAETPDGHMLASGEEAAACCAPAAASAEGDAGVSWELSTCIASGAASSTAIQAPASPAADPSAAHTPVAVSAFPIV